MIPPQFPEEDAQELRVAYQTLLNNVLVSNNLLAQETDESGVLSVFLSIARLIIDFEAGAVFQLAAGSYKQISIMDNSDAFSKVRDNYLADGIYDWAIEQKRTVVMPEGDEVSHILVPLVTEQKTIGILDIRVAREAQSIKNRDLDILGVVAANTSSRCEQVQLNRWSGLVDTLLSNLEEINHSDRATTLFEAILSGLRQLLHCSRYLLLIKREKHFAVYEQSETDGGLCFSSLYKDQKTCPLVEEVLEKGESVRVSGQNNLCLCTGCPYRQQPEGSDSVLLITPLMIDGRAQGVIAVSDDRYNSSLLFDTSQKIVELLAKQAALSIHQSELNEEIRRKNNLLNEEIKMAGAVQQSLLPPALEYLSLKTTAKISLHLKEPPIVLTGTYLPSATLGGDFYDFIDLGDFFFITIADVSGHGLPSSLLTAMFKMALHKLDRTEILKGTGDTCRTLNNDLHKFIKTHDYITAFIGLYEKRTGILTYTGAGHPYPLHYDSRKENLATLEANSLPLGLFPDSDYFQQQISLKEGDKLLLYTDGVTECFSAEKKMYGSKGLMNSVKQNINSESVQFLYLLLEDLARYTSGYEFEDDISMLLMELK